jgi:hypothetical protein
MRKIRRHIATALACGTTVTGMIEAGAAMEIPLPNPAEFREGDRWDAQVPGTHTHSGMIKKGGRFVPVSFTIVDHRNTGNPGIREFTDLGGDAPRFPLHRRALFAAPDGFLYAFNVDRWDRINIGHSVQTVDGPILVTERMTPGQADALTQEIMRRRLQRHIEEIIRPGQSSADPRQPRAETSPR